MSAQPGSQPARIPSGKLRQLGPINWLFAKVGARTMRVPEMHLFTTLGQRQVLFWTWAVYNGRLLRGRLPTIDTELVILRVAHLRSSEYELQHHRRMAREAGLDTHAQAAIFAWPQAPEGDGPQRVLSARQQALLNATDELITQRSISTDTYEQLATHLNRQRLIEFCMLATHYDGLAATISALAIPLDRPR